MSSLVRLIIHPVQASSLVEVYERMRIGPMPPWVVLTIVALSHAGLVALLMTPLGKRAAADEVRGIERERAHWKV